MFKLLRHGLLRYIGHTCPNLMLPVFKAAPDAGLPYASVNHSILEFCRQVHGLNQMPVTAGTQTLDRAWQDLKKYVPSEITAKDKKTKKINPALWDWIYSWMWRRNSQGDLWAAMPELFHWVKNAWVKKPPVPLRATWPSLWHMYWLHDLEEVPTAVVATHTPGNQPWRTKPGACHRR